MKESVAIRAKQLKNSGELDSISKFKALQEALKIDLSF